MGAMCGSVLPYPLTTTRDFVEHVLPAARRTRSTPWSAAGRVPPLGWVCTHSAAGGALLSGGALVAGGVARVALRAGAARQPHPDVHGRVLPKSGRGRALGSGELNTIDVQDQLALIENGLDVVGSPTTNETARNTKAAGLCRALLGPLCSPT